MTSSRERRVLKELNDIERDKDNSGVLATPVGTDLTHLKGIQLGKVKDEFGWCQRVSAEDGEKVVGTGGGVTNGENGRTVDQMD